MARSHLSPRTRSRLRWTAGLVAVGFVMAMGWSLLIDIAFPFDRPLKSYGVVLVFSIAIGGTLVLFHLFYAESRAGAWLRRLPMLPGILVRSVVSLTLIGLVQSGLRAVLPTVGNPIHYTPRGQLMDLIFGFCAMMAIFGFFQLQRLIGIRIVGSFLVGRYYRPVEEERVFLFFDLVGSTPIAQALGHLRAHDFISRFFFEIDEAVLETGGEVHRYIGDAALITWSARSGLAHAGALRFVFRAGALIEAKRAQWQADFGQTPAFRAGIHVGRVVVGECGDSKQEIVFTGDAVNTAARVQDQCKQLGHPVLVSGEYAARVALPAGIRLTPVAKVFLRGRSSETELHAATLATGAAA